MPMRRTNRNAAGRKVLSDPKTHRYYLKLNDEENERFLSMMRQTQYRGGFYPCTPLRLTFSRHGARPQHARFSRPPDRILRTVPGRRAKLQSMRQGHSFYLRREESARFSLQTHRRNPETGTAYHRGRAHHEGNAKMVSGTRNRCNAEERRREIEVICGKTVCR